MTAAGEPPMEPPPVQMVRDFPLFSKPAEWTWTIDQVGKNDATGEPVYLYRIRSGSTIMELWAPRSFMQDMAQRIGAQTAGLTLARDLPRDNGQRRDGG